MTTTTEHRQLLGQRPAPTAPARAIPSFHCQAKPRLDPMHLTPSPRWHWWWMLQPGGFAREREEGESAAWQDIGEKVKLCDGLAGASASDA